MAIVMLFVSIALTHKILRGPGFRYIALLFVITALTFGSDRIFAIQAIAPLGGCVVLGVLLRLVPASALLRVVLPIALGTAAGQQVGRVPFLLGMFAPPTDAVFELSVERVLGTIGILMPFFRQFTWLGPLLFAFLFFSVAYVGGAAAPQVWPVLARNKLRLSPSAITVGENFAGAVALNIFGGTGPYTAFTDDLVLSSVSLVPIAGNVFTVGLGTKGNRCISSIDNTDPAAPVYTPYGTVPVTLTVVDSFGASATSVMTIRDNGVSGTSPDNC
jgi:hypothetical protein